MCLSYGEHLYPEFVTVPLCSDNVTPMCQPEFLANGRVDPARPDSLRDEDLTHVTWRVGFSSYPDRGAWLEGHGVARPLRHELGHTSDTSSLAIDLACAGCGMVFGQSILAEPALATGVLVAPFAHHLPLQYEYCAVHTQANERNPSGRAFVDWLAAQRESGKLHCRAFLRSMAKVSGTSPDPVITREVSVPLFGTWDRASRAQQRALAACVALADAARVL